jgi:plastocyanin
MAALHLRQFKLGLVFGLACLALVATAGSSAAASGSSSASRHLVVVPQEDRFAPFVLSIHTGDAVEWVNNDTDDHTVVTNNAFTTAGYRGLDHLLNGTDSNGGKAGTFTLVFPHSGVFAYYCRFHATLDSDHQPIAPGPDGGIQDANGNFGTPMNGIINVQD